MQEADAMKHSLEIKERDLIELEEKLNAREQVNYKALQFDCMLLLQGFKSVHIYPLGVLASLEHASLERTSLLGSFLSACSFLAILYSITLKNVILLFL